MPHPTNENDFAFALAEALHMASPETELEVAHIATFEEAGVLTLNAGLVVTLEDGTEYQVTVVRSR